MPDRPSDEEHVFADHLEGDRPGESRIKCSCGWISEHGVLDLDVHLAEVNGISYTEQKARTAAAMRKLGIAWPDPMPLN